MNPKMQSARKPSQQETCFVSELLMTQSPACGATAETVKGSHEQCEGSDLIVR